MGTLPKKVPSSLSSEAREVPFLHTPYRCTQKCHRKPPLLRGEQSEPWISTPLSLEQSERSSLPTDPLPVHTKVPQKPPLLRGEQSKPWISTPSLSSEAREVPFLHTPYRCTQKCQKKTPLLRGKQSEPWISTPLSLKWSERSSLSTYPFLVHTKVPHKTTTFERRAERGLTNGCGHSSIYCISAINLKLYNDFTFPC